MGIESFDILPPDVGEGRRGYCLRLQDIGHEEMFIRKALAYHFRDSVTDFSALFNEFELARLRHLTKLRLLEPNRTEYSFIKKVSKNLGISEELAGKWFVRFQEVGDVRFVGMDVITSK